MRHNDVIRFYTKEIGQFHLYERVCMCAYMLNLLIPIGHLNWNAEKVKKTRKAQNNIQFLKSANYYSSKIGIFITKYMPI